MSLRERMRLRRGRRFNRVGLGILIAFVALIVGGFVYTGYLAFVADKKVERGHEEAVRQARAARSGIFAAPKEQPAMPKPPPEEPPRNAEPPATPQPDPPSEKESHGPPPSEAVTIGDKERRVAAVSAWKKYYALQEEATVRRAKSLMDGRDSLWQASARGGGDSDRSASGSGQMAAAGGEDRGSGRFASNQDKTVWANRSGGGDADFIASMRTGMITNYQIMEGTNIPLVLEDGIFSGLPIGIKAKVRSDVYCAVPGGPSNDVCIPAGSTALIDYNTKYEQGECRVQAAVTRLRFEDNSSMGMDNMPVGDPVGYAGLRDECDRHLTERILSAVLFGAIDAAFTTLGPAALGADNVSAGRQTEAVAQDEARRGIRQPPTMTIRPGFWLEARAHKDILFDGPYEPMTTLAGE